MQALAAVATDGRQDSIHAAMCWHRLFCSKHALLELLAPVGRCFSIPDKRGPQNVLSSKAPAVRVEHSNFKAFQSFSVQGQGHGVSDVSFMFGSDADARAGRAGARVWPGDLASAWPQRAAAASPSRERTAPCAVPVPGQPGTQRLPRAVVEHLRLVHLTQLDELSDLRTRLRATR